MVATVVIFALGAIATLSVLRPFFVTVQTQYMLVEADSRLNDAMASDAPIERIVELLRDSPELALTLNADGTTQLFTAVLLGRADLVDALVAAGCPIDARAPEGDWKGSTALHVAIAQGQLDVIQTLLRLGARTDIRRADGRTPRELARARGRPEIAALFRDR